MDYDILGLPLLMEAIMTDVAGPVFYRLVFSVSQLCHYYMVAVAATLN